MDIKVVDRGLKVDLHIHSSLSSHKDGKKVNNNTDCHLVDLVSALNKNQVNMCAITDHDAFDYEMYQKLKQEEGIGFIKKVFPGVEFSVEYEHNSLSKQLHVVALFDDSDSEKVKNIAEVLKLVNGKPDYDCHFSFSERKFIEILRNINLNTVMIVHQKGSLSSTSKPKNHDANSLGEDKLQEFLYTEYFEAYEFKNKKNELFAKKYAVDNEYQELLRLITGSDCHSWISYPKIDESDNQEFEFTWLKCLPSFRGLVMAMTDYTRIKRNDSFFAVDEKRLTEINFKIDEKIYNVPLSKGINAIIGDNSIGKSLLLHKMTYFNYTKNATIKKGYEKYLLENNFDILSSISDDILFMFDKQGEIREKFEKGELNDSKLLRDFYPSVLPTLQYTNIIDREISKYCEWLKQKVDFTNSFNDLSSVKLFIEEYNPEMLSLNDDLHPNTTNVDVYSKAVTELTTIIHSLNRYLEDYRLLLLPLEIEEINAFIAKSNKTIVRMKSQIKTISFENKKMNVIKIAFKNTNSLLNKIKGDIDKESTCFYESMETVRTSIVELIKMKLSMKEYSLNIDEIKIDPLENEVYKYKFINKLGIDILNNEYINNLISNIHMSGWSIENFPLLTDQNVINSIKHYPESDSNWRDVIIAKSKEKYKNDFKYKSTILSREETDLTKEMSSGKNMQIYFDLISFNTFQKGIYIVDQPEDSVSQKAIKNYLLTRFKNMSENRQVIIVTHNPQFIVNLDVDNVIFISRNEVTDKINIQSGALEYEDKEVDNYKILDIVANNIDGGIESINRRWKRYEKTTNF